jgi:hypothetical protein
MTETLPAERTSLPAAEQKVDALMRLIERAVLTPDFDVVKLEKLFEVKAKWDALEARRAFDAAMAAARAELKPIAKKRLVDFPAKDEGKSRTTYKHESLGDVAEAIDPILAKFGLSYRFRTKAAPDQPITVVCIVTHAMGHAEENEITAKHDATGNKNSIQAIGSTITYLQRYTLKAALGLAAAYDDDGKAAGATDDPITEEQRDQLCSLLMEVEADVEKFCSYIGVEKIVDLRQSKFGAAIEAAQAKRRKTARKDKVVAS